MVETKGNRLHNILTGIVILSMILSFQAIAAPPAAAGDNMALTVTSVDLLNSDGQIISSVGSQDSYRIEAQIANNNTTPTTGLIIIQVRGGSGASSTGGGQVLGCVGLACNIPLSGSTVSSNFTMPTGISGSAYVDVFVWNGWNTMMPGAEAKQDLNFTVTN